MVSARPRARRRASVWAALGGVALLVALLAPLTSAGAQVGPEAPANFNAVPGNGQVTLSWTAGVDNGSTVLRWEYRQSTPATNVWIPIPGSHRNTFRHTVTGLTNGTAYGFQVRAVSGAGNGAASTASPDVVPSTVPAAPAGLRVDVGNSVAVLLWTAAVADTAADGFSAISSYQYRQRTGSSDYGPWTVIVGSGAATADHTVGGLLNGTSYQFQIRAVNDNGAGASAETTLATVGTVPGRPRSLSAVPGDQMVTLSWTASSDGGYPVTSWQFRLTTDDGVFAETAPAWVAIPESGADTTFYTVVSLDNARRYKFQVRAVNARGEGATAESAVADPGTAPGAPTGLSGAATHDSITLTWSPPLDEAATAVNNAVNNGGNPIVRYEYSVSADGGDYGEWIPVAADALFEAPVPAPPAVPMEVSDINLRTAEVAHVVRGLTRGTPYRFRVRAVNAIGASDHVGFQDDHPVYLGTRPPSPAEFSARAMYSVSTGTAEVELAWTSGGDGDSPITRWQYRTHTTLAGLSDNSLSSWVDICNSLPAYSGPALRCHSSTDMVTLPRAPLTPGGTDGPDGTLAFTIGSEHFFVIRAVNAHGDGLLSVTASAEFPVSVPTAPEAVYIGGATGSVSSANITLNWRPSLSGGSPILRYEYAVRTGTGPWGAWTNAGTGTTLTYDVASSTSAGAVHRFRVRAVNGKGPGTYTQSPAIVAGAPGTPGATDNAPSLNASPGNSQITLSLTGTTGNTDATTRWEYSYRIGFGRYSDWTFSNTGAQFNPGNINPIDGLRNGVTHNFRIRAVNAGGLAGPELVSASVRPGVAPPAPLGLRATPGDQQITLSWTSQGSGGRPIIRWQVCGGKTPPLGTYPDCGADENWADIHYSRSGTTSHTITTLLGTQTPLTNGESYTFQVRARNSIGGGAPAQTYPATPGRVPGAPSRLLVDAGSGRVTITVYPPLEDNGSSIVGYEVRKRRADGPYDAWEALGTTATAPATPSAQSGAVVSGLINGVTYTFQIRAVNAFGPGPATTSAPITPTGAPTVAMLDAEAGDTQAELTWVLGSNGGRPITGWQYRQSESGGGYRPWTDIANSGPDTTGHTVGGLTNGVSYTFQVRAVNSFGASAEITSASITPAAVPAAVAV